MTKELPEIEARLADEERSLRAMIGYDIDTLQRGGNGDEADDANANERMAVSSSAAEIQSATLRRIEDARKRIHDGVYGICQGCKKSIPKARLNALPYAENCVSCQRDIERNGGMIPMDSNGSIKNDDE